MSIADMKEDLQPVDLLASVENSVNVQDGAAQQADGAWGGDSEQLLARALDALRCPPAPRAARPDAAPLLARLAAALPARDTRFLDDYLRVLISHADAEIEAVTDELMRSVEGALAAGEAAPRAAADAVVLAAWLAAATVWRAPRTPAAARALHQLLQDFQPNQVEELARALHAALEVAELLAVGEAVRGAGARGAGGGGARAAALAGGALAALLLRAALGKLAARAVGWRAGALGVGELSAALAGRWARLGAADQLAAARLAGRALAAAAARGERGAGAAAAAGRLLAALAHPPPPHLRHHPEYLKVIIALTKLQTLFKNTK